jgi:hypothetical protein
LIKRVKHRKQKKSEERDVPGRENLSQMQTPDRSGKFISKKIGKLEDEDEGVLGRQQEICDKWV